MRMPAAKIVIILLITAAAGHAQNLSHTQGDSVAANVSKLGHDRWLDKDKADHFIVSGFLTGAQYYVFKQEANLAHDTSMQMAVSGALLIGIGKEVYDKVSGKGTPSFKDLLADVAGIAIAGVMLTQ